MTSEEVLIERVPLLNIGSIFFKRLDGSSSCTRIRIIELGRRIPKAIAQPETETQDC
ncbi:hypothetical protein XOCgx_3509 [Xanthomonas oryzae pv. oryzicola]|nr:hypothetical protein XOCgx_3509 [Xanthomonas oryzae pv. oryzicola]